MKILILSRYQLFRACRYTCSRALLVVHVLSVPFLPLFCPLFLVHDKHIRYHPMSIRSADDNDNDNDNEN